MPTARAAKATPQPAAVGQPQAPTADATGAATTGQPQAATRQPVAKAGRPRIDATGQQPGPGKAIAPRQSRAAKRVPLGKQRKRDARSRVTNGSRVLPGVDNRTEVARRYFDITSAIIADQGGVERLAEARLQLIRRFCAAAVMAEQMEAALANGQAISIADHAQLTSSMVRCANKIGINRRAKELVPTLQSYLETQADVTEAEDEEVQ